jgi:hypothetical protein
MVAMQEDRDDVRRGRAVREEWARVGRDSPGGEEFPGGVENAARILAQHKRRRLTSPATALLPTPAHP